MGEIVIICVYHSLHGSEEQYGVSLVNGTPRF